MELELLKQKILRENNKYQDLGIIKSFIKEPEISTTKELMIPDKELSYKGGVSIGPSIGVQIFVMAVIVLVLAFIADHYVENDKQGIPFLIILCILSAVTFFVYKNIKSLHRTIKIDRKGINIKSDQFEWQNILETFILIEYAQHDTSYTFLVVVDKKEIVSKYEITFFGISYELLSTIIEYYKKENLR